MPYEASSRQTYTGTAAASVDFPYSMTNGSSGAGRIVLAFMQRDVGGGYSMAYNGQAPTRQVFKDATFSFVCEQWDDADLPADTASHNLTVNFGGARTNVDIIILEVSGASQGATLNATPVGETNTDPHTISHTTLVDSIETFLFYMRTEDKVMNSEPTYDTLHESGDAGPVHDAHRLAQVTGPATAGLTNYTWDPASAASWVGAAIDIPFTGGGGASQPASREVPRGVRRAVRRGMMRSMVEINGLWRPRNPGLALAGA